MKSLIIAEHNNKSLSDATFSVITASYELAKDTTLLVCGYNIEALITKIEALKVVDKIIAIDALSFEHHLAEDITKNILSIANEYEYILIAHNTFGKNILPRISGKLNIMPVSDIIKIHSITEFIRPMYAGNILATVQVTEKIKLLSIRTTCFSKTYEANKNTVIQRLECSVSEINVRFIKSSYKEGLRPDLTDAKVVVVGGRSLQSKDNFSLLEKFADLLQGAIGGTRAAVDAGYIDNEYQVGQTGKIIAPEIYFAVGVSGAIQHIAGIKDSKVIVAINKDPDALIFSVADYGIVGDLFQVIPELIEKLSK